MSIELVKDFHSKFRIPMHERPMLLSHGLMDLRFKFMLEELSEMKQSESESDLPGVADALIDLAYVVLGTAAQMGLPWEKLFDEVHKANMEKELGSGDDQHKLGIVKPKDWKEPEIQRILDEAYFS